MKIKVPTKIDLNGFEVEVKYFNLLKEDERLCGQFKAPNTVEISLAEHNSKASLMATITHELYHAIFDRCGITHLWKDDTEECLVRAIENHLAGPLKLDTHFWTESKFVDLQKDKDQ